MRSFQKDERGGIAVGGIFMIAFLAGAVFYSASIAHTANQRDGLQQSADAAVFAEAVVSARGMNMISSMNVIMVALNAVELPVRAMAPSYKKVAAMPCADPCTCQIVADAKRADGELTTIAQSVEQRVGDLLTGISEAQTAIAQTTPKIGQGSADKATRDNKEFLQAPRASLFTPSLEQKGCKPGLPIEDDTFTTVCKRAKKYTPELAMKLADDTLDTIKGACKSGPLAMADAAPKFPQADTLFCTEAAKPPCGGGAHPKKVMAGATNGSDHMQFWSRVDGETLKDAGHAVDNIKNRDAAAAQTASNVGFAQSEIYFDCTGAFATANVEQQAMYDTQWTARLRRIKKPTLAFAGDTTVKTEIADPERWSSLRKGLLDQRRTFWSMGPTGQAGTILTTSQEGPLQ